VNLLSMLLRPAERRAVDASQFGKALFEDVGTHAKVTVDDETALRFVTVYACVSLIADSIAAMPCHAYRRDGDRRILAPRQPPWLNDVDSDPNPETDRFTLTHRLLTSLLLPGNAYLYLAGRDGGVPAELWNLHPRWVTPRRVDGRIVYTYRTPDGQESTFSRYSRALNPQGEVVHLKAFDNGGLRGLSPIDAAREAVGLGIAAEEYGARFFGQGAVPPGLLVVDNDPGPEQLKSMAEWFRTNYSGRARAHVPAVVRGARWEKISIDPEAAQFLETRKYQVAEIARLFRVPPHMVGDVERTTSWGAGVAEQNRMFFQVTLTPWVRRLEIALSSLLPPGEFVRLDPAGLLRGDIKARYDAYKVGRDGGWLSANDVRRLEDMEPIDGGDEYLRPMNTTPASAGEEHDEPETTPPA